MERERKSRPLYRPLNGEEIRLIEIYRGDWDDPIACQLHYVPLDGSTAPDYVALSYAWGDQSTPKAEICVNGREREIGQSLFTALRQLRSFGTIGYETGSSVRFIKTHHPPELNLRRFRLWADALCINQKDDKDREHQIPLMRQIYRCANYVFVWLGENEPQDEPLFKRLSETLLIDDIFDSFRVDVFEKLRGLGGHLEAAKNLLLRSWFTRLWVVQEIALPAANTPLFFAGRNYYSLLDLYSLSWSLDRFRGMDLTPVLWIALLLREKDHHVMLVFPDLREPYAQGTTLLFTTDFSYRFLLIQNLLKGFKASRPHDYIYAILGLCGPDPLPPALAPNYEKPFPEVCRDYAVATIGATGSLRVLARQKNCLDGVPSWVPDFSADSTDRLRDIITKSLSARKTKFSVDQSRMLIEACKIGECATICDTNVLGDDQTQILFSLRSFARATAASSSATYDNVLTRLAIQCASVVWDYWEHQLSSLGISYKAVLAASIITLFGGSWPAWLGDAGHFDFVSQKIVDELTEAAPISTADGILSFVHRKDASPRCGDILVVPLNSPFAWLLQSRGDDTFSLVSTCNLRQLEAGHYAPLILENFASSRELKNFTIV